MTNLSTGRTSENLNETYDYFFAYPDGRGFSDGDQTKEVRESIGLLKQSFEKDIILKWPVKLLSALRDRSKKVVCKVQGREFQPVDFTNPEGQNVYLSVKLRSVVHAKTA